MLENIRIHTSTGVDLEFEPAGLGSRILAYLIDAFILVGYSIAVIIILRELDIDAFDDGQVLFTLLMLPVGLYHFLCETLMNGQSVGKLAFKIQVVRLDGKQPTVANYALRSLLRILEITAVYGSFAMVSIISTRYGQRLGDLAAGTTVVRVKREGNLAEGLFREADDSEPLTYPEVSQLTNRDAETLGILLENIKRSPQDVLLLRMAHDARLRLTERLGTVTNELDIPYLEGLLKDFNRFHSVV